MAISLEAIKWNKIFQGEVLEWPEQMTKTYWDKEKREYYHRHEIDRHWRGPAQLRTGILGPQEGRSHGRWPQPTARGIQSTTFDECVSR